MKNYKLIAISAVSVDGVIGIDGEIPWHISEDFKHFRNMTMGHALIIGINTYLTLPEKAFEGREYFVLDKDGVVAIKRSNVATFETIDQLLQHIDKKFANSAPIENENNLVFVAGGAMVYNSLIDYCDEAVITWVNKFYLNGNKFFPIEKLFANFASTDDGDWLTSKSEILYKVVKYKKL